MDKLKFDAHIYKLYFVSRRPTESTLPNATIRREAEAVAPGESLKVFGACAFRFVVVNTSRDTDNPPNPARRYRRARARASASASAAAFSRARTRARGALMATRCVISATEWSRRAPPPPPLPREVQNEQRQTNGRIHALALARRVNTAARFGARTPPRPVSVALGCPRREIAVSRSPSFSLALSSSRAPAFFFRVLCEDTARFRKNGPARRLTLVRPWREIAFRAAPLLFLFPSTPSYQFSQTKSTKNLEPFTFQCIFALINSYFLLVTG